MLNLRTCESIPNMLYFTKSFKHNLIDIHNIDIFELSSFIYEYNNCYLILLSQFGKNLMCYKNLKFSFYMFPENSTNNLTLK